MTEPLVVCEGKGVIVVKRAAEADAVLVEPQRKLAGRKEGARVEDIVAQELVHAAVQAVAA